MLLESVHVCIHITCLYVVFSFNYLMDVYIHVYEYRQVELLSAHHWVNPHVHIQVSIGAVGTFQPALPSRNMKLAKVEAALAALQSMGILGPDGQQIL